MLPFHPAANIFPLLDGQDFADLKADIAAHGQREPIWTYQGQVIDGRNRARACDELAIEPKLREWDGNGSLVSFVVSLNLHRRHLGSSQRAAVAAEMLPLLEAEAKQRQRQHGGTAPGRAKTLGQKVAQVKDDCRAAQQAATIAGTNRHYVAQAKQLKEEAPELFEQVKRGEINVARARHRMKRQRQMAEMKEAAPKLVYYDAKPSWSYTNRPRLREELAQEPPFKDLLASKTALQDEAQRLWKEAERAAEAAGAAQCAAREAADAYSVALDAEIEQRHGPLAGGGPFPYRLPDDALAELQACENEYEQHELLREFIGRCDLCDAKLSAADLESDHPWNCLWCAEHRGVTHCYICGAPLADGEHEDCAECQEREMPWSRVLERLPEVAAFFGFVLSAEEIERFRAENPVRPRKEVPSCDAAGHFPVGPDPAAR
jgi:hypothetical protein